MAPTEGLGRDVLVFLGRHGRHGRPPTARQTRCVEVESRRTAAPVGSDAAQAETVGWLYQVGAVVPWAGRAKTAFQNPYAVPARG